MSVVEGSETAVVGAPSPVFESDELEQFGTGDLLGRYVALEEIGRGGMGRVIRAYDPKLQREVALKEVRRGSLGTEGTRRLLVEARAMAKLSHPNVVAVYDVEELSSGRLVIAMEYVPGRTLKAWLRQDEGSWSDVVARFMDAGRGLAAAHSVGLLHRDFKPSNVLVGEVEGAGLVVKVTDFGLAKIANSDTDSLDSGRPNTADDDLTEAGVVMGTPRYMAPEQHRGETLTVAADQYSFCVALWEALADSPPFGSPDIASAKHDGPPSWPDLAVPATIGSALRRGLAPNPDERWPSMEALLEALAYDPARRRTWTSWAAVSVVAAAGLGAAAAASADDDSRRCSGATQQLADIWNDDVRQRIGAAFASSGSTIAEDTAARLDDAVDAYASQWIRTHEHACEAATVRAEQSPAVMDLRMACLHRAKVRLAANVAVLEDVDAEMVPRAHELVDGLPSLDRCSDIEALLDDVEPPPPEDAQAVERTRTLLADIRANLIAGRYEVARDLLGQARSAMEETEYGPLRTEFALEAGDVHAFVGEYAEAEAALRQGLENAAAWGQWDQLLEVTIQLMMVAGSGERGSDDALRYLELARGLARDKPFFQARILDEHARILSAQGKSKESEAVHREAVALFRSISAPETTIARTLGKLAGVLYEQGRYGEAAEMIREALDVLRSKLGPEHPDVFSARANLALVLRKQGQYDEAERELREVLALRQKYFGPDHLETTSTLYNLGLQLRDHEKFEDAETLLRRALEIRRRHLEPDNPRISNVHSALGGLYQKQEDYDRAEVEYRRALEIRRSKLGPEHPDTVNARHNLAVLLRARGQLVEAQEEFRVILGLQERLRGPDHLYVGVARRELAKVALARNKADLALDHAEAAWAIHGNGETTPTEKASSAFVLAQSLAAASSTDADRKRARELADRARELYRNAGAGYEDEVSEVSAWARRNGLD